MTKEIEKYQNERQGLIDKSKIPKKNQEKMKQLEKEIKDLEQEIKKEMKIISKKKKI